MLVWDGDGPGELSDLHCTGWEAISHELLARPATNSAEWLLATVSDPLAARNIGEQSGWVDVYVSM